jgi:hypothetical protein
MLGNGIAPRYCELVDSAIRLTFGANDLVELACIEIDKRRGSGARRFERRLLAAKAAWMALAILTGSPCPPTCM